MNKKIRYVFSVLFCFSLILCGAKTAHANTITNRIWGANRIQTAIEISKSGWTTSNNVVLATEDDFPDALCAVPLAKQMNAPILLVSKDSIDSNILTEIQRLKASKIFIIGGTGVISQSVENALQSIGKQTERLGGRNRYETSAIVASNYFKSVNEISVATGDDFPDALSIASIAASKGMPILLVSKDSVDASISNYVKNLSISNSFIVGGEGVIYPSIANSFANPKRLGGKDRYNTNAIVLNNFFGSMNYTTTYVATGDLYPDALTGSALAAKKANPLVLVGTNYVEQPTIDFISNKNYVISNLTAFGGTGAVSDATITTLLNHLSPCVKGIDVSKWQGTIDWNAVKKAGYEFAIVQISHGQNSDPNFQQNVTGAKNAGLKVGGYHFAQFQDETGADQEAQYFISQAKNLGLDYVMLDSEEGSGDLTNASLKFLDEVHAAIPSAKVFFYANPNFIQNHYNNAITKYPLWIANYNVVSPSKSYWSDWSIWQTKSNGYMEGIIGDVDIDVFNPNMIK